MARVSAVHEWDWDANACCVSLDGSDARLRAPLPPFASPFAAYPDCVVADGAAVTRWGAPVLDDDPRAAVESALVESPEALREASALFGCSLSLADVLRAAAAKDVQVVDELGPLRGVFDGLGLAVGRRAALAANHPWFGRHKKRCFKPPHAVVFPTHEHAEHHADFSRSEDATLRRLSKAQAAWRAVRLSRFCGYAPDRELVEASFGAVAAQLLAEATDAFALVPRAPPAFVPCARAVGAVTRDRPGLDGASFAHCFSLSDATVYFAPCVAAALPHPHAEALRRAPAGATVASFAVHETEGVLFVTGFADGGTATASDGRTVSRGGLVLVAHPPAAEGGWALFRPESLAAVGFFCPVNGADTWRPELVQTVLSRLARGGRVHTNGNQLFQQ